MHLMGVLCLALSCVLLGLRRAAGERHRVRLLRDVCAGVGGLKNEICVLFLPLPEAAERLSRTGPALARPLFSVFTRGLHRLGEHSAADCWSAAVEETVPPGEAREVLLTLGSSLGRYDAVGQAEAFAAVAVQLGRCLETAGARADSGCRLWTGLGLAAGVLVTVVLV